MRKPVIAGNWKMFKRLGDAVETALALKPKVANAGHCEVVLAPAFVHIKTLADRLEGSNIRLSAQDAAPVSDDSANTGEVSAGMLVDIGCTYAIVGHSERRQLFKEDELSLAKKLHIVEEHGMIPVFCIG